MFESLNPVDELALDNKLDRMIDESFQMPELRLMNVAIELKVKLEASFKGKWVCSIYTLDNSGDTLHLLGCRLHRCKFYQDKYMVNVFLL